MSKALARLFATGFYVGYIKKGPGTAGSLLALAIAWVLHDSAGFTGGTLCWLGLLGLAPARWAAGRVAAESELKDPQFVVIDEIVGQWIAFAGASRLNWKSWIAGFVLFRLFDIWKPPPVRQIEKLPGGTGIVLDDAMAGVYAAVVLFAAGWFDLY